MGEPVIITTVAERVPGFSDKAVEYPMPCSSISDFLDTSVIAWYEGLGGKQTFTFPSVRSLGVFLWYTLRDAVDARDEPKVRALLAEIAPYTIKNSNERSALERWAHTAVQMPEDIGGINKDKEADILTSRARGRVLETMCGFNSYFRPSPHISEVVALDYCAEMLERYEYPERTRILFDLERIKLGEKLDFFGDNSFDTVGCWGSHYLSEQTPVFSEFARVLRPGGSFLILENTSEGYRDRVVRHFDPEFVAQHMSEAGLKVSIEPLPQLTGYEGKYYLVTGKK